MANGNSPVYPIFLTTKQAAHMLGCNAKYLQSMIRKKKGPPHYRLKNATGYNCRLRFKQADLMQWVESTRS